MSTYLIFKNNKYVCEDRKVYVPCDMKTIIFIIYKNQLTFTHNLCEFMLTIRERLTITHIYYINEILKN